MTTTTDTPTDAKAPAWLNIDSLIDAPTRALFDELASEIETACYEHEELIAKARAALALADRIASKASDDLDLAITEVDVPADLCDGVFALLFSLSGAARLRGAMAHLSDGFHPENDDWTPGGFRKEGENR